MIKNALLWGFIAALIMIGMFYVTEWMYNGEEFDYDRGMMIGFATMILAMSTLYFGVKKRRTQASTWNFMKAWGAGLFISLFTCIFYVAGWMVYSSNHPETVDNMVDAYTEKIMQDPTISEEAKEIAISDMEDYKDMYETNPVGVMAMTFLEPTPVAFLMSLLVAFLLRKPKEEADNS